MARVLITDPQSTHRKAPPAFYSENTFMIDDPIRALQWLEQIHQNKLKHLAKINIFVHAVYDHDHDHDHLGPPLHPADLYSYNNDRPPSPSGPKWCEFFDKLARKATGLRDIYIYWDAAPEFWHFGGGYDVDVVRSLARIKGLQKLEIGGYF